MAENTDKKKILLLSHIDMDGYMSQTLVMKYLEETYDNCDYDALNINYGDEINIVGKYDTVIVTDLTYDVKLRRKLEEHAANIMWIDHHYVKDMPIIEPGFEFIHKIGTSATKLVCEHLLTHDKARIYRELIEAVNDADVFTNKGSMSFRLGRDTGYRLKLLQGRSELDDVVIGRLFAYKLMQTVYDSTLGKDELTVLSVINDVEYELIKYLSQQGLPIEAFTKASYESLKQGFKDNHKGTGYIIDQDKESGVIHLAGKGASDIADMFITEDEFKVVIVSSSTGVSVRSSPDMGIARILCEMHNGGGHDNAGGCKGDVDYNTGGEIFTEAISIIEVRKESSKEK